MRGNGSILGRSNYTFRSRASGMWSLNDAGRAVQEERWPIYGAIPPITTNLARWWDATVGSSLYDTAVDGSLASYDGTVKRWEDMSGNNLHATSTGGAVRKSGVLNGYDALLFSGSGFSLNNDINTSSGGAGFIVGKKTSSNNSALWKFGAAERYHPYVSEDFFYEDFGVSTRKAWYQPYTSVQDVFLFSVNVSTTLWKSYFNNQIKINTAPGINITLSGQTFGVGWAGYIGEILIYNSDLSDSDHSEVRDYLLAKWSIT